MMRPNLSPPYRRHLLVTLNMLVRLVLMTASHSSRHLHEHAVPVMPALFTSVNGPMLGLGLGKGVGGEPVQRRGKWIGLLLIQPFLVVAAGAATSNQRLRQMAAPRSRRRFSGSGLLLWS